MRKFTIPTWFTIGWLGFVVFLAIFGPLMPLRPWEYVYENSLGVVPFSKGHLLGTDTNGFDLLSSVVIPQAGARESRLCRRRLEPEADGALVRSSEVTPQVACATREA